MNFSERMKIIPEKQIQIESIDTSLRNRIINKIDSLFDEYQARYVLDVLGYRIVLYNDIFNVSLDHKRKNLNQLITLLEKLPWNNVYDVIENGYHFLEMHCEGCINECYIPNNENIEDDDICIHKANKDEYSENFNTIFEQEKSGYRLIDGLITPIIDKNEIDCIEEASNTKLTSVDTHLQKALSFYSDRENPDYENSIKESISAVEAMCCIITGLTGAQATLSNALKHLEDKGIHLHGALKTAFNNIYGYTSDESGIRHGGIDFKNAPAEDAKYMLISCSAFVNYLIEKYSKIGGTN